MNLHLLIAEGDLDAVAEALAGGADVEARTATDATPLYAAMASRSLPMVELLLAHGADPNAIQENLSTWDRDQARIHRLEGDGDHATTARAKALGVASPRTVLSASVGVWGNVELVRRLLDAGARIDVADPRGWTPLHYAAHGRAHNDVLELLVGAGADLHARTSDGHTALALCCVEWRSTETRCLLRLGATLSEIRRTELHLGALRDSLPNPRDPPDAPESGLVLPVLPGRLHRCRLPALVDRGRVAPWGEASGLRAKSTGWRAPSRLCLIARTPARPASPVEALPDSDALHFACIGVQGYDHPGIL